MFISAVASFGVMWVGSEILSGNKIQLFATVSICKKHVFSVVLETAATGEVDSPYRYGV
jgi:hypothetical protein